MNLIDVTIILLICAIPALYLFSLLIDKRDSLIIFGINIKNFLNLSEQKNELQKQQGELLMAKEIKKVKSTTLLSLKKQFEQERTFENEKYNKAIKIFITTILLVLGILITLLLIFGSVYTIQAGHRGVVLTFGKPSPVATSEGFHFKIPIAQKVVKMDVRTQKYEATLTAASADLQDVSTIVAINYHLSPASAVSIYQNIGIDYADKYIYPLEHESNKASTAQFTAIELVTKREDVREMMKRQLTERLLTKGIIVEEVSIIDFKFSPSFSQAIEAKVTAEQLALQAKNKLEQTKYEAEQRIAQAKGEADAIKIQAQAINAQGGKDYVALQAISKWNGVLPQYSMGGVVPFIDITAK